MIFPGFSGALSFFKVFQEMWEPCGYMVNPNLLIDLAFLCSCGLICIKQYKYNSSWPDIFCLKLHLRVLKTKNNTATYDFSKVVLEWALLLAR